MERKGAPCFTLVNIGTRAAIFSLILHAGLCHVMAVCRAVAAEACRSTAVWTNIVRYLMTSTENIPGFDYYIAVQMGSRTSETYGDIVEMAAF